MMSLSKAQQELLLDFYFSCGSPENIEQAKQLLITCPGAREFYDKLSASMSLLDHLNDHSCPEHLVETTVAKLTEYAKTASGRTVAITSDKTDDRQAVSAGKTTLGSLLEAERRKTISAAGNFWMRFREVATIAAVFVLIAFMGNPVLRNIRYKARQTICSANLARIAEGIQRYSHDFDNCMPAVRITAGQPWWKIGSRGAENVSNTRPLWLLVKGNYCDANDFLCPGRCCKPRKLEPAFIRQSPDFPSLDYITYSFRLNPFDLPAYLPGEKTTVIISDRNPLFDKVMKKLSSLDGNSFDPIELSEKLAMQNSTSHCNKGQNLLFSDGSVIFSKTRKPVNLVDDDIFTIQRLKIYRGTEFPQQPGDVFLVP